MVGDWGVNGKVGEMIRSGGLCADVNEESMGRNWDIVGLWVEKCGNSCKRNREVMEKEVALAQWEGRNE